MKEATGETSMTMITLVAIGVIAAILAIMWPYISSWIQETFRNATDANTQTNGGASITDQMGT